MRRLGRFDLVLAAALIACIALGLIAVWRTSAAAQAWLGAYLFWAGLPIGALLLALAHGLTGGEWGMTLRPALTALLRTTPLLALLLVPALVGARHIYPWATSGGRLWLALPFFVGRSVVYVVLWNVLALGVLRQARPDGLLPPGFAWPALILTFATATLAAFDWLMTLEPGWTSTIFGMLVTAGWTVSGLAAAIALSALVAAPWMEALLDGPARLLLALVCLWAYLSTIQLIVIWESNLAHEIPWYLRRSQHGWQWVALAMALLMFATPFFTLIWRPLRQSRRAVLVVAAAVLAGRIAESWWLSLPDFGRGFGWTDALAFVAIGAAFLYVGGRDFPRRLTLTEPDRVHH